VSKEPEDTVVKVVKGKPKRRCFAESLLFPAYSKSNFRDDSLLLFGEIETRNKNET